MNPEIFGEWRLEKRFEDWYFLVRGDTEISVAAACETFDIDNLDASFHSYPPIEGVARLLELRAAAIRERGSDGND